MTQEMYGASGKVGNKTYYRSNGKTIAREIVPVKNPKTDAQTIQRVIVAQVGKDYKKFKDICDHSFQGISTGANSMNEFRKLNTRRARRRASEIQQAGQSLTAFYSFQPIGSTLWVPDACILSQGELPKVPTIVTQDTLGLWVGGIAIAENTYAGVCNALGLQRGDQLTLVTVEKQYGEYVVLKSRVILDPRNADGSGAPMSSAFIDNGAINCPNWRNDTHFSYLQFENSTMQFTHGANGALVVASACIVSRKDGSDWLRSNSELVISEEALGSDKISLWDAVETSYNSDTLDVESELYLNNAGTGGSQGSSDPAPQPSTDPTYNNTVALNNVNQNVAGGSVSVTAPLTAIAITGTNLTSSTAYLTVDNGAAVQPANKTATAINFTGLSAAAGTTVRVYKSSGNLWFTINVVAAGGGAGGGDGEDQ